MVKEEKVVFVDGVEEEGEEGWKKRSHLTKY